MWLSKAKDLQKKKPSVVEFITMIYGLNAEIQRNGIFPFTLCLSLSQERYITITIIAEVVKSSPFENYKLNSEAKTSSRSATSHPKPNNFAVLGENFTNKMVLEQ
jgi:hypothetical protein